MEREVAALHLQVGELILSPVPARISTVLGSCVSVCLFSRTRGVGGMIHFAHPRSLLDYGQAVDLRYGEVAIPALIREMEKATGEPASNFIAKIVGGANEGSLSHDGKSIGTENIVIARELLRRHQIKVAGEDVGGSNGRRVLFHTASGRLQVADIVGHVAAIGPAPRASARRKVLIVDDSKTIRELLKKVLEQDPELEIVGLAADAIQAAEIVERRRPDVVTLDVHMPIMSGVEWLEKLLAVHPIPVVMISSLQLQDGNEIFKALELGAIDYVQKPSFSELGIVGPLIREKVKEASFAKVVKAFKPGGAVSSNRTLNSDVDVRKVLAIGSSTGGTEALKSVLCALPKGIPPTLIVQHIPAAFSRTLANRLNDLCPFEVKEAEDGDALMPSRVLIAPGGQHMKIERSRTAGFCVRITDDAPVSSHKPSVDYLFHSIATEIGKNAVGVILTGMGSDGAKGLLAMRKAGARTLGQDEESCVVYGMPRVAFEVGAVEKVVSLTKIPQEILALLSRRKAA